MFEFRRSSLLGRALAFAALLAACLALIVPPRAAAAGWPWPVDGEVLTSYRNGADPYAAGQHRGIDIAATVGTPVRSTVAGEVTFAGKLPEYGNCVTVAAGKHLVSFLHLDSVTVRRGARVRAGAALGTVGVSGKRSVATPHLHLGVRIAETGAYIDPLPLLAPRPAAKPPAGESAPTAQPKTAQPPAAERPGTGEVREVRGRDTASRGRAGTRSKSGARGRHESRSAPRSSRPSVPAADQVHAPPPGDTAAADPAHAAAGSAREGHASRGRVAPPPLSDPATVGLTAGAVDGADARSPVAPAPSESEPSRPRRGVPWIAIALAAACCAIAAIAWRRRRKPGHDAGPGDSPALVIERRAELHDSMPKATAPSLRVVSR